MSDNDSLSPIERDFPRRINNLLSPALDLEAQGGESYFTLAAFWHVLMK